MGRLPVIIGPGICPAALYTVRSVYQLEQDRGRLSASVLNKILGYEK